MHIAVDGPAATVRVTNRFDFRDLSHLSFVWSREADGAPVREGALSVPPLRAGRVGRGEAAEPAADGLWTVRALEADGHEVAWGQSASAPTPAPAAVPEARPVLDGRRITLGPAAASTRAPAAALGRRCRGDRPRLDVWRAPTDNDNGASWQGGERLGLLWREFGLHRMRHRVDGVEPGDDALTVRTRVAPAGATSALRAVYRWTADEHRLRLTVSVVPDGDWRLPPPRLGVRFGAAGRRRRARSAGSAAVPARRIPTRGRRRAWAAGRPTSTRCGRRTMRPQENGARADVRWAEIGGLRIDGDPAFWFTARRWTTEQLDAAEHRGDLVPGDTVWVSLDHAHQGIGSQSCGPGVLPQYRLTPSPARFTFTFTARD